ncbi:hypothetical protein PPL_02568 [Heterostelium album PN500]|uniref:Uncharacterized protein n=1 Tax=Heterostelium pallidum (strain ATCC 26659 / Pp 5 / PN500) TaxID=670386 RepID=D3B2F7_HETP5|nr:hypothetical protein PPL_02568 [Heterostelium album PN500]EFA84532.1 hypothetical protein PPL_02568 [Heterostelium album PN500]|eukprot:XP_020436645.1 hypothetical protein PPL_02568 [Heterostelium album PN500]
MTRINVIKDTIRVKAPLQEFYFNTALENDIHQEIMVHINNSNNNMLIMVHINNSNINNKLNMNNRSSNSNNNQILREKQKQDMTALQMAKEEFKASIDQPSSISLQTNQRMTMKNKPNNIIHWKKMSFNRIDLISTTTPTTTTNGNIINKINNNNNYINVTQKQ